ncbi:hypothetical protein CQW23_03051 [Capsicum baccatum]|uniref:Translation elongation factor EFG/EF2 domain-containing protein n=1 Tax=Capsicum baccatum TaxID=33114 RepID=A0A2G2XT83_CAPBA|nr:hypothetical protein CQW23_03051 [Capsicum baccatum]
MSLPLKRVSGRLPFGFCDIRVVLTDGASHNVDSSELAFKLASIYAFRQGKGEFTIEYIEHAPISGDVQTQLFKTYKPSKES